MKERDTVLYEFGAYIMCKPLHGYIFFTILSKIVVCWLCLKSLQIF